MRNMRKILYGLGFSLLATAAFALTVPPTFSPRMFQTQQVHYMRFTVNFNSCTLASGTCSFKVGAIPYNSWLTDIRQQITTSFNSGTTDTVGIGTATGGVTLVAAQSVHGAAGDAAALTVVHPGITSTGNGIASTGAEGGFDIWVTYTQTGSAPTAGTAVYLLTYAAPNDGSCAPVPLGSTAPAC